MKTKIILLLTAILISTGCVKIKNTERITLYLQEQGIAEILAVDIKNKKQKDMENYKTFEKVYNSAAGTGNGWTKAIITNVRLKKEVDVSVEDYKNSDVAKEISKLQRIAASVGNEKINKGLDPVTIGLVVLFAKGITGMVIEQNNKEVDRVAQVLEDEFKKVNWTTFELTTQEWIISKYGAH